MGDRIIYYWFNGHGYKTTRGQTLKNNYVFAILKKKKIVDERMYKKYKQKIEKLENYIKNYIV